MLTRQRHDMLSGEIPNPAQYLPEKEVGMDHKLFKLIDEETWLRKSYDQENLKLIEEETKLRLEYDKYLQDKIDDINKNIQLIKNHFGLVVGLVPLQKGQ